MDYHDIPKDNPVQCYRRPEYPTPPQSSSGISPESSEIVPRYPDGSYGDSLKDGDHYSNYSGNTFLTSVSVASGLKRLITVSISTSFHPDANPSPDTMISSSDGVLFYVCSNTVSTACPTAFEPFLSARLSDSRFRGTMITLDIPSSDLNLMLQVLYGFSPRVYSPDFAVIVRTIDKMPVFGMPPAQLIQPKSPLHDLLIAYAPLYPLDVYALAAHSGLRSLAINVSTHLLSYDLSTITDSMAERIGAVYLNRLLLLHVKRFQALKDILVKPPHPHAPTNACGFEDQRKLTRAWALVCAYLCWDSRPDISSYTMDEVLSPLKDNLDCELCQETLRVRIKDVLARWASIKASI